MTTPTPTDRGDPGESGDHRWRRSYEWQLFADWCDATDHPVLPTTWETVTAFLAEIPCSRQLAAKRLRAIHRVHRQHAHQLRARLPSAATRATAWRSGIIPAEAGGDGHTRWLSLAEALAQLPVYGYPYGVPARRDGAILVAVGLLGWTRTQTTALQADQVSLTWDTKQEATNVRLVGDHVPRGELPEECAACAITRWCRALAAWHQEWHQPRPWILEESLYDRPPGHDCTHRVPPDWRQARVLAPYIGPEGLPAFTLTPLTPATITRILKARLHPHAARDTLPDHVLAAKASTAPPATGNDPEASAAEVARVPAWKTKAPMTTPARRGLPDPDGQLDDLLDRMEHQIAALDAAITDTLDRDSPP